MTAALKLQPISVDEYLSGELVSAVKHEYLGGFVYAMSGARNLHNRIKGNVFAAFHRQLRGGGCHPYDSDTKIRVRSAKQLRFYYPDVSVVCQPNSPNETFQDAPAVVVEVLSRTTRRTDESEKRDAYLTISSLSHYLLVEQDFPFVAVYRRTDQGFVRETYQGLDAVIPLPGLGIDLPLAEVYDGVQFTPEPDETDER